jgi:hypothetical protein
MSILIADAPLTTRLAAVDAPLAICTSDGRVLGYFTPAKEAKPFKLDPEISEEEIERRLAAGGGRPLADILRDLMRRDLGNRG